MMRELDAGVCYVGCSLAHRKYKSEVQLKAVSTVFRLPTSRWEGVWRSGECESMCDTVYNCVRIQCHSY